MPIYEYACDDCGTHFEKLVRRTAESSELKCPSCGHDHLTTQYSTFAAQSGRSKDSVDSAACGSGMCGSDFCGQGGCGMDMN